MEKRSIGLIAAGGYERLTKPVFSLLVNIVAIGISFVSGCIVCTDKNEIKMLKSFV